MDRISEKVIKELGIRLISLLEIVFGYSSEMEHLWY